MVSGMGWEMCPELKKGQQETHVEEDFAESGYLLEVFIDIA